MRCSNCGFELQDGALVCPRCGTRQRNSGNNINRSGGGSNGGFGIGKIIAIIASLVLVVGISLFVSIKINSNRKIDFFTHNIDFDKDNLTVQDEKTLRYREVPQTQTFSIGSSKGFVNIDIVDEMGDKVNFVVDKTVKNDRYIIKPDKIWDNTHTYYLSLGEDTYFTDEAMFKFNRLIYTIKRENVAEFKYNDNIKNTVENPNIEVNEGDLVIIRDEDGGLICRKVKAKDNGNVVYEIPNLTEVFEDLNLHSNIQPNLNEIFSNQETKKQLLYNVLNSDFFDYFVMTTYAAENNLPDGFELAKNEIEGGVLKEGKILEDSLEISASIGDKKLLGNFEIKFEPKSSKKYSKGIAFELKIERKVEVSKEPGSVKPIDNAVDNTPIKYDKIKSENNTLIISVEIDAPTIVPDIDIKNKKFDFCYSSYVDYSIDFNFDLKNTKYEFEKEEEKNLKLLHMPINSGIPCIFFFFDVSLEPEIKFDGTIGAKFSKKIVSNCGITYEHNVGFREQKLCTSDEGLGSDTLAIYIDGSFEAEAPLKLAVGLKIALLPDEDVKAYHDSSIPFLKWIDNIKKKISDLTNIGYVDLYGKAGGFFELEGKLTGEIEFPQKDANAKFDLSMGAGVSYKVGIEGELKIDFAELKADAELKFIEGKWYLFKYNKEIPIASNSNTQFVTINVADEGNYMKFGNYDYLVLKKDVSTGKALLISKEGINTKPYSERVDIGSGVTWAQSSLRKYLNGDFINIEGGFSDTEKESIYKTIVKPDGNNKVNIDGGAATTDKIFILSKSELEGYFNKNELRELKASSKALSEGAYVCQEDGENRKKGNTVYWVRTPGNMNSKAMVVNSNGSIFENGVDVTGPDNIDGEKGKICVRPALWVNYIGDNVSEKYNGIAAGMLNSVPGSQICAENIITNYENNSRGASR